MPLAVRFKEYGGVDVLDVMQVDRPRPGAGDVLVRVKAAGINPGEAKIREGLLHDRWPATFPSGQGSDLAGIVEEIGEGVTGFAVGDAVIGFTNSRGSQAEYVVVRAVDLTHRPDGVSWEAAGSLFVAGTTAYAAVRAVSVGDGDTLVVSGAAGGVGSIVVQLAKDAGARVIGLAGEANHEWLAKHGAIPIRYGDGVAERIKEVSGGHLDAFIDTHGGNYVELALDLGIRPDRIDTIVDFRAAGKYGVKNEGNAAAGNADVLAKLATLVSEGRLEIPIAMVYSLSEVRDAYRELERGHTRGKIVLTP